jgi:lysophospholipid acyltransferase (LPLAT)-like uncharacterized protein
MSDSVTLASPATEKTRTSRRPGIIGFAIWAIARAIASTLRLRTENVDIIDRTISGSGGAIIASWHGRSLISANYLRGRGYLALISLSRDGEVQNHIFRRFGFETIRGSTGRGGARAALLLTRRIKEGAVLAFTPDGPRGPTHVVQPGILFFAQRSGRPIIPIAASARPRKLLKSWDSYMIPMPFGRASFVVGEPIFIAQDLDEAGEAAALNQIADAIDACEARAEMLMGYPPPAGVPSRHS